jgi:hypothetical protein
MSNRAHLSLLPKEKVHYTIPRPSHVVCVRTWR